MSRVLRVGIVGCLVLSSLLAGGCSLIGYHIGKSMDNDSPTWDGIHRWKVKTLGKGRQVKMTLRDGELVHGDYQGLVEVSSAQYGEAYEKARRTSKYGHLLPGIGETVEVAYTLGINQKGEFLGFGFERGNGGRPWAHAMTGNHEAVKQYYILMRPAGNGKKKKLRVARIGKMVGRDGIAVEGSSIRKMAAYGEIPVMTHVVVNTYGGLKTMGIEEIESVSVLKKPGGNARWVGLAIGLALDAAVVAAGIALGDMEMDWSEPEPRRDYHDDCNSYDSDMCCGTVRPGSFYALLFAMVVFALLRRRALRASA